MEQIEVDCLVIGAGVVGLAIARRFALAGREVLVLEKESAIGTQVSSRNSEVIHAGIYYPQASLKAQLCVVGKTMLYDYCQGNHIPYKRCGKLLVATSDEQLSRLLQINAQAELNGVNDLKVLELAELKALEPEIEAKAALFSPSTGVLDSHAYMLQLQADLEAQGGQCVFNSEVEFIRQIDEGLELDLNQGDALIKARCCINSAGLNARPLLEKLFAPEDSMLPKAYYAKGSYFSYSGPVPFTHLIYPIPEPGGLGVHLTLDMQNVSKFGPDVEWLDVHDASSIDYAVDPCKKDAFYQAIRKYWPEVNPVKLHADYSGVRPKISAPGTPPADFSIQGPKEHGISGLINLLGIESPGLSSSLAIADYVLAMAKEARLI